MTRFLRSHRKPAAAPAARHWLALGGAAAALYVAVVFWGWPYQVRLLYDGLAPLPPYRWVHPPAGRSDNAPPLPAAGTIALDAQGSRGGEISTDDDQALVTFPDGAVAARPGESAFKVTITPLDPAAGAPAPTGRRFDGNAYRIDAVYAGSATPVILATPVTIVLRYPIHATQVLRSSGAEWTGLPTNRFDGSQQVLANSDQLGIFIAASGAQASGAGPGRHF